MGGVFQSSEMLSFIYTDVENSAMGMHSNICQRETWVDHFNNYNFFININI